MVRFPQSVMYVKETVKFPVQNAMVLGSFHAILVLKVLTVVHNAMGKEGGNASFAPVVVIALLAKTAKHVVKKVSKIALIARGQVSFHAKNAKARSVLNVQGVKAIKNCHVATVTELVWSISIVKNVMGRLK